MTASIAERARFDLVRYANCWEDADLLVAALRPQPGRRMLSIASAGDNSFALLAAGSDVVAVDLSPAQLALTELKAAAIRRLERAEVLEFLGIERSRRRSFFFDTLRAELSTASADYWRDHRKWIEDGVVHQGKFERYFALFRRRVLPLVHRRATILAALESRDTEARRRFYEEIWNNGRWRFLFRVFFSRFVMGRLGRDPEFFRYVQGSVAERILKRAKYALTAIPTNSNPYLEYILTGSFRDNVPRYLRPEVFEHVRARLGALTLRSGSVTDVARESQQRFDGFNLSDIFEYPNANQCRDMYATLLNAARPGARLAYWNMLVPRSCPAEFAGRVRSHAQEANELFARDKAFFYQAFVLEEVR